MIQFISRKELDTEKYNYCIKKSKNCRIYAFSWYLDVVAEFWDVLVLKEYQAVMPLPWKRKYLIKYVYCPVWTQQLGIFSNKEVTENLIEQFVEKIPKKFQKITISLNSGNVTSLYSSIYKRNYILNINASFEKSMENFNSNRKRVLKKSRNIVIRPLSEIDRLIETARVFYSFLNYSDADYKKLKLLSEVLKNKNKCILLGAYNKEEELLGGVFFLKDDYRITYLFSVATNQGKKFNITTHLICFILKNKKYSNHILDFEGSVETGIEKFYKSFGAEDEGYNQLKINFFERTFF